MSKKRNAEKAYRAAKKHPKVTAAVAVILVVLIAAVIIFFKIGRASCRERV